MKYKCFNNPLFICCSLVFFLNSCKKTNDVQPPLFTTQPNIIFFLADDVGYEVPACNGGQSYSTPNIDLIARQGTRFTQCHTAPLCSPSRIMLLTGKYNFRNYTTWGYLDPGEKTIANMLHNAGYATCVAGKWQLDSGDASFHNFGFDTYSVWNLKGQDDKGSRYKSPLIFENGSYLPPAATQDKYADDLFTDFILNFIQNNYNTGKPFFVYYPLCLCHSPFSPTPDDADYASWPADAPGDVKYFPSMVKYMDKKIGEIISKVQDLGIKNNTVVMFSGDNGTSQGVTSLFNGTEVQGGKDKTTEAGTHVPLLVSGKNVSANATNEYLIDFPDFLPTLAQIAGVQTPVNYGVLDGINFYPRLSGGTGTPRNWSFCYFQPHQYDKVIRFVQNAHYKYYSDGRFYDIISDILELHPISDLSLTVEQKQIKNQFINVLNIEHT